MSETTLESVRKRIVAARNAVEDLDTAYGELYYAGFGDRTDADLALIAAAKEAELILTSLYGSFTREGISSPAMRQRFKDARDAIREALKPFGREETAA